MKIDNTEKGKVKFGMINYVENIIKDFPMKLQSTDIATKAPAGECLFIPLKPMMMTSSSPSQKFFFINACTVSAYAAMFHLDPFPTLARLVSTSFADVENKLSVCIFCNTALLGWAAGKQALLSHGTAACKKSFQLNTPGVFIFSYCTIHTHSWNMAYAIFGSFFGSLCLLWLCF